MHATRIFLTIVVVLSMAVAGNNPCAAGLIATWSFDGTLVDAAGGNNNGTWQGGDSAVYVTGRVGSNALSLDGASHYLTTPDAGMATGNSPSTLAFWVNSTGNGGLMVVSAYGTASNYSARTAQYGWDGTKWNLAACSWNLPDAGFDAYGTIDGNWHQVVMPYDGTYTKLYVDGQYKTTSVVNQSTRTTALTGTNYIGRNLAASGYFVGLLDDMAMWNDASMSDAEIAALWNAPQVAGLGDYGVSKMDQLFQVYDGTQSAWPDGANTWTRVTGLTGHAAGDVWSDGSFYYAQLDASGGGVATPEPATWLMAAIAAAFGWAVFRRKKR